MPLLRTVDRHRYDNLVDFGRYLTEVDDDRLVVPLARAGEIVTGEGDGALRGLQIVEENKVLVGEGLAVGLHADSGGVQVEVGSGGGAGIPTEPDRQRGELGRARLSRLLGQADVAALGEADGHL